MKAIYVAFTIFLLISITFATDHVKNILSKQNVKTKIMTKSKRSTAILFEDGSLHAWGNPNYGGLVPFDIPFRNVKSIVASAYAFAVLFENGRVYAWGDPNFGGKIPWYIEKKIEHQNIQAIVANDFAFAVIAEDRSVYSWGHQHYGGKIPENIQSQLRNVVAIFPRLVQTSEGIFISKYILKLTNPESEPVYTGFSAKLENGNFISWALGPHFDDKTVSEPKIEHEDHIAWFGSYFDNKNVFILDEDSENRKQ